MKVRENWQFRTTLHSHLRFLHFRLSLKSASFALNTVLQAKPKTIKSYEKLEPAKSEASSLKWRFCLEWRHHVLVDFTTRQTFPSKGRQSLFTENTGYSFWYWSLCRLWKIWTRTQEMQWKFNAESLCDFLTYQTCEVVRFRGFYHSNFAFVVIPLRYTVVRF